METGTQVAAVRQRDMWGLTPPPGIQLWWGARAIYEVTFVESRKGNRRKPGWRSHYDYSIDLVWDRQGFYRADGVEVSGEEYKPLQAFINDRGLKELRKLVKSEQLFRDEDRVLTVEHTTPANISKGVLSHTYTMMANPRQSHGYLYIGAWRKQA
jgi:hypothetical protein